MPDDQSSAAKIHAYAAQLLSDEIERFWKRALFFWGFLSAAFVAYGVASEKLDESITLGQGTPWRCVPIIFVGVTAAFAVAMLIGGRSPSTQAEKQE